MKCLNCKAEVFAPTDRITEACPKCKATAGYKQYDYTQTNEAMDLNHAAEVQGLRLKPERRQYYTGGMCFANTLHWMAFKKQDGTKDLESFFRRYVGNPQEQVKLYQEFLRLMGKQDKYINRLFGSFDHYINYEVSSGASSAEMAPTTVKPKFRVICDACGKLGPWTEPAANTQSGGLCANCGKLGRRQAGVSCESCANALVVFESPGLRKCPTCPTCFSIGPAIACRTLQGQMNHDIAHREKASVYRKQARKCDLTLLSYENGFMFNSVTGLVAEIFSKERDFPAGYLGVFGFEGDNGNAHVTSFWIRKGWIGFFDPNLGEFLFPSRASFELWFSQHLNTDHWPGDPIDYREMHDAWYVALFS